MGAQQALVEFIESDLDFVEWNPEFNDLLEDEEDEDSATAVIELSVPQSEFIMCEYPFPLFVAGFGSGKSTALCIAILRDLRFYNGRHPIKIGCYCPTYDLLKLITIPYLAAYLSQSGINYTLNKSDYIFYLDTGDQIIMRSMANPDRIVGYQTFRAHIDEIDTLSEDNAEYAWNKIIARNRQKIYEYDDDGKIVEYFDEEDGCTKKKVISNKVSGYTTPEGYKFCYKRWARDIKDSESKGYKMIRASTYSNKHLHPDYIKNLIATYPSQLIEAYIEGFFVNLTSGSVYPSFKTRDTTTGEDFNHTDEEIKPGEALECGMDFNVRNMSVCVGVVRNGQPRILDEIDGSLDTRTACEALREKFPNHTITIFPDASGNNTSSKSWSESDMTIIREFGFKIKKNRKNPFIKDRIISLQAQIQSGDGERKLKVNTHKCPNVTECLLQQVYGKDGMPDKKSGKDHFNDCVGYWIFQKWPVKKSVKTSQGIGLFSR